MFGLPGNPVSSLVCFEIFVRPAIARLAGGEFRGLNRVRASLASPHQHRGDRPTYHPAVLSAANGQSLIKTLSWQGSADLCGLAAANALAVFEAGDRHYAAGETVDALLL